MQFLCLRRARAGKWAIWALVGSGEDFVSDFAGDFDEFFSAARSFLRISGLFLSRTRMFLAERM